MRNLKNLKTRVLVKRLAVTILDHIAEFRIAPNDKQGQEVELHHQDAKVKEDNQREEHEKEVHTGTYRASPIAVTYGDFPIYQKAKPYRRAEECHLGFKQPARHGPGWDRGSL